MSSRYIKGSLDKQGPFRVRVEKLENERNYGADQKGVVEILKMKI